VCSIPNVRHFRNLYDLVVNGDWEYKDSGVMDRTHLRFFTKKSINSMFIKHGYNVLTLEGINETPNTAVKILSALSFGFFEDTRYLQYACVAQPS